jgi:DNA-directed RNA polymerase subunit M
VFCEKCKSLMLPRGKVLVCTGCKAEKAILNEKEFTLSSEKKREEKVLILEEEDVRTLPTIKAECPKCGHMEAEWWLRQTRKADEAETRFFRCTKCAQTWREYN